MPNLFLDVIRYLLRTANHKVRSSEDREPSRQQPWGSAIRGPCFPAKEAVLVLSVGAGQMPRLLPQGQCPFSPSKDEEGAIPTSVFPMSNYSDILFLHLADCEQLGNREDSALTLPAFLTQAQQARGEQLAQGALLALSEHLRTWLRSWGLANKHPVRTRTTAQDHMFLFEFTFQTRCFSCGGGIVGSKKQQSPHHWAGNYQLDNKLFQENKKTPSLWTLKYQVILGQESRVFFFF